MERIAKEIQKSSQTFCQNLKVKILSAPSGNAQLVYFLPYSIQQKLSNTIVVSQFTHQEQIEPAKSKFIQNALEADYCITNSKKYENVLIKSGVKRDKISMIYHGVDKDIFKPNLRIGVVGRTYHTGRKGETLLAEILKIPEVEFFFIGNGWPMPSKNYSSQEEMSKFYNDIDYLLIPSLIEGGPVPLFEALSSGCPVISSDVGCVEDFPHIPFKNNDPYDLRRVITKLIEEKNVLRHSVNDLSWESFGKKHVEIFLSLLSNKKKEINPRKNFLSYDSLTSVNLILHGTELKNKGGPSTRIELLNKKLNERKIKSTLSFNVNEDFHDYQIYHIFNSWPLTSALDQIKSIKKLNKKIVFSPIALNLAYKPIFEKTIPNLLRNKDMNTILENLEKLMLATPPLDHTGEHKDIKLIEGHPDHFKFLKECISLSDGVIFLSEYEKKYLEKIGASVKKSKIVNNTSDLEIFKKGDPSVFKKTFGIDKYILCVGRVEQRKNQIILALASKTLSIPVVYIGHLGDKNYFELLEKHSNSNFIHIDRIEDKKLLASAYKGAEVLVLNSWAEGAPLVALEAGAAGTPLILSNMSSEKEYFNDWAFYIHPCDVKQLKIILEKIEKEPESEKRREERSNWILDKYHIEKHVHNTIYFYNQVLIDAEKNEENHSPSKEIFIDITHITHAYANELTFTGVNKLELNSLNILKNLKNTRFICWNSYFCNFFEIKKEEIINNTFKIYAKSEDLSILNKGSHSFYARYADILDARNIT